MTQEYKENILNQLVGKVQNNQGTNTPQFSDADTTTTTINTYIANAGHTQVNSLSFWVMRNNKILLFYNEYTSSYSYVTSFIVITDNELQPIAIINTLESGNPLPMFSIGISNDIGEGRIYFISINNNRLYYINDPTSKKAIDTYHVNILASYQISVPGSILGNFKKDVNGGNFVFASFDYGISHLYITEFQNNVGIPSEWNTYEYNFTETYFSSDLDFYPIWNDGFSCRVAFFTEAEINGSYVNVVKVLDTQTNSTNLSLTKQIQVEFGSSATNSTLISYTKFAFMEVNQDHTNYLHLIDIPSSDNVILKKFIDARFTQFKVVNDILFIENIDGSKVLTIGLVQDRAFYEKSLGTLSGNSAPMFIQNNFNLYTISFLDNSNVLTTYLIYNVNNYNGQSYNNVNSVVSNSCILYNSNNKPIFARNLYNKTFISNTEIDTLNVPNFLMNDTTIASENILSMNNNIILNETGSITKNQYENVFINFFNTINVIDNNTNENIMNEDASSYFVNGINSNQYDNLSSLKYKVNFEDGTNNINDITDVSINNLTATLTFVIYVPKTINSVEIISNDGTMKYATLPTHTYNTGSYYKIEQEITIQ